MKARLERTSCVFGNEHVTALMKSGELKRFAPVEDLSFLPLPAGYFAFRKQLYHGTQRDWLRIQSTVAEELALA